MNELWLRLTLLDDAVLSERSATAGGHRTLDHVPGAALLGAVAARSYSGLGEDAAFRVFHSGRVRFGAACPVGRDGGVTVPTPLSFHVEKNGDERALLNRAVAGRSEDKQWKLAPGGFRDSQNALVRVAQRSSMRTSVARDGRARDGHLYTLSAIARGATYLARVDADDATDLDIVRALQGTTIRVGKGRSAEFGGVQVEVLDAAPPCVVLACETGSTSVVRILAVADLVLRSADGAPTFTPTPTQFGLPQGWSWDPTLSFVRTRVWSPYNAARRRPDLERQAIVAGSVLTFRGDPAVDLATLQQTLARGVGDGRGEGLGRVLVNPRLLADGVVKVGDDDQRRATTDPADATKLAGAELLQWLERQEVAFVATAGAWDRAMEIAQEYAASRARLPRAQWGELRRFARVHARLSSEQFVEKLKAWVIEDDDATSKVGRSTRKGERRWGQRVQIGGRVQGLGRWLVEVIDRTRKTEQPPRLASVLELVAIHAPRRQSARVAGQEASAS